MTETPRGLDALLAAAAHAPVDVDGLSLEATDDGYVLETPQTDRLEACEATVRRELAARPAYVTNWRYWEGVGGEGTARRAFLRWCERAPAEDGATGDALAVPDRYEALADGIRREWGQLSIRTELADDGDRRYHLRHVADAPSEGSETVDEALEDLESWRELRELTTTDEKGRYRPLKTAPTLVTGWTLEGLAGTELLEAVEAVYPATVTNWHLERRGDLDVTHWRETAARQTGIYDVVEELPREALEWVAEACCVDSQCLKRREWHADEDDDISVDGGDGEFPCREPCSIVVAAARKWAILEGERERTWTLELTTSEMNQLSAIVDAVADGRLDEIREAELHDGANRYRARYLRAKRFEEDGTLPATDADDEA